MNKVADKNTIPHYAWGDNCSGWWFVDRENLSVIREQMPPATAEQRHFHEFAFQFFYIIDGEAVFEIDDEQHILNADQGILIEPGKIHRIINQSDRFLEFMVISSPKSQGDRKNTE